MSVSADRPVTASARPLALVTGASAGLGEAYARALAARGHDLVLTARREDRLEAIAKELRDRYDLEVRCVGADLTDRDAPARVVRFVELLGREIDLLVNNAGFGAYGEARELPVERDLQMIDLNVRALVELTKRVLPSMVRRRIGAILHVASVAAFQPVPYMATYGATKAFVLHWSEALAREVGPHGVRILAVCPGTTATEFQSVAGVVAPDRVTMSAETVVQASLRALDRGRHVTVPGALNKLLRVGVRLAPRSTVTYLGAKVMKGRTPRPR